MSNSETLILTSNKKTIKVNNKGDEIVLDLDDMSIRGKLEEFFKTIDEYIIKINSANDDHESYNYSLEMSKKIVNLIDDIFGDNASIKLFGNSSPTIDLIYEFGIKFQNLFPKFIKSKIENQKKIIEISNRVKNNKYIRRQR